MNLVVSHSYEKMVNAPSYVRIQGLKSMKPSFFDYNQLVLAVGQVLAVAEIQYNDRLGIAYDPAKADAAYRLRLLCIDPMLEAEAAFASPKRNVAGTEEKTIRALMPHLEELSQFLPGMKADMKKVSATNQGYAKLSRVLFSSLERFSIFNIDALEKKTKLVLEAEHTGDERTRSPNRGTISKDVFTQRLDAVACEDVANARFASLRVVKHDGAGRTPPALPARQPRVYVGRPIGNIQIR